MQKNFFDYIIILRVGKANVAKKEIYCVKKQQKFGMFMWILTLSQN